MKLQNKAGMNVGQLDNGIYTSHRKPNHVMGQFGGGGSFGISDDIVTELTKLGCKTVVIIYNGKQGVKTFTSDFSQWITTPFHYTYSGRLSGDKSDPQTFVQINNMVEEKGEKKK